MFFILRNHSPTLPSFVGGGVHVTAITWLAALLPFQLFCFRFFFSPDLLKYRALGYIKPLISSMFQFYNHGGCIEMDIGLKWVKTYISQNRIYFEIATLVPSLVINSLSWLKFSLSSVSVKKIWNKTTIAKFGIDVFPTG